MVILDESSKDDRTELSYGDMGVDHLVTTPRFYGLVRQRNTLQHFNTGNAW